MRARRTIATLLAASFLPAFPALAQQSYSPYEMQYGDVIDVQLDTLIQLPESYVGRAVRTSGRLDMLGTTGGRIWALATLGSRAILFPVREAQNAFEMDARQWLGREIEVTGVVSLGEDPERHTQTVIIAFWTFFGPPEEKEGPPPKSAEATLEELLTRPGSRDGDLVRVVGQFRGANLYGDLPSASRRRTSDWVIKNDLFAAWITGTKPRGSGFRLDPRMKRDTGRWLEVQGRVRTVRGVVYIEASDLKLSAPPTPTAKAEAPERPPPPPPKPPVIVFSLPLDGERDVPSSSVFKVQFSKDMEVESFEGRVVLRYAGRPRPGDRPLDAVKVEYDGGRRALAVDPGDLLRPGRVIELLLLPGIVDLDGLPLEPRPAHDPGGAADVLRYQVAPGLAADGSR